MNWIACKFVDYLIESKIILSEQKEDYVYSFEVLLGKILNYSTLLILGYINQNIIQTLLFMVTFLSLRGWTGGYHASKESNCYLGTIVIYYFVSEIGEKLLSGNSIILVQTMVISIIVVFLFSPMNHPNLQLSRQEIQLCKRTSRWLVTLISVVVFFAICLDINSEYISYVVAGIGMDSGLLILSKILKQEVQKDESSERKNFKEYC